MSYSGVLEPLLRSAERSAPTAEGRLTGQRVVTHRREMTAFIAVDADQNVHFLLAPAPASDERFARFNLKGLTVRGREWAVGGETRQRYLDLTCAGGTQQAFRRPFLAFCEDLLLDLDSAGTTPEDAAFRTCNRWQRFWTADDDGPVSIEWLRGLLGELRFLEMLVEALGPTVVSRWTGPAGEDHDFQAMRRVAFEVKVASGVPYTIECNLHQLDSTLFDELYLVCYQAVREDDGESIVAIIARLEAALGNDEQALDRFLDALQAAGYRPQRRADYDAFRFAVDGPFFYVVDDDFPRITTASFTAPLDGRIRGVRYRLQLTDLSPLQRDHERIVTALRRLT